MVSCVAFGCKNSRERGVTSNVHYHRFPFSNPSLLAKWTSVIGFTPRKQSVLCSDHFTPRDYKNLVSGNLKDTAVPSKFKRLPSLRIKLSGVKETIDQDVPKTKPQSGRRSASQPTKDNSESPKKRKKDEKKRQSVKRKREEEEEPEEEEDRMEASPENDPKLEKIETSSNSEENPSADCSASKSIGIEETVEPPDTAILLLIKAEETPSGASAKQTKPATKRPPRKKPTPGEPKKSRSRKILRLSSDESEGELEAMCAAAEQRATASNVQMDSGEVLAAVRVELDENELSDNGQQQPVNVFKKWTDNGTGFRVATKFDALKSVISSRQKASSEDQQKRPLCTVPADMDHVVAVNERRTRYRYIYRVGQCFPEEDDDAPFITSKLNFVVNALQSQNDKVLALEKRCRELSRSNSTLKDILGIPDNEEQVEAEELDPQQEAYLIIGTLPSTSASLPLYRFTLTDRSPTVIAEANGK